MKLFLGLVLLLSPVFAEDAPAKEDAKKVEKAPAQPTDKERFELMQLQRDFLMALDQTHKAEAKQADAASTLDQRANEVASKYKCARWNPDFTCVKDEPKKDEKAK